jgi:hypothetical protein
MEETKWFENFWSDGTKGFELVAGHANAGINSVTSLLGFLMERYDIFNSKYLAFFQIFGRVRASTDVR